MPFQSEKQRRFLHANHPEIAKRWERDYANGGISNHFKLKDGGRTNYIYGGISHPDGRRGFPGGAGTPGGYDGGASQSSGGGGEGGYQNVHQTGAVTQTPGRRTTPVGGGDGPPSILNPPKGPRYQNVHQTGAVTQTPGRSRVGITSNYMNPVFRKAAINKIKQHQLANRPVTQFETWKSMFGADVKPIGYLPENIKPKGIVEQSVYDYAIKPNIGAKDFKSWYETLDAKPADINFATTIQKELELSDKVKALGEDYVNTLNPKGWDDYDDRREAVNTLLEDVEAKKNELKGTDKSWMLDPSANKSSAVSEFTSDYSENEDRLNDLGITSKEEYKDFVNKAVSLNEGGVARKNYFHGGILDINESEEIISDDGNDIELTAYNAAFDDPNDLSTGVRTLFQAKDGGRTNYIYGGISHPGGRRGFPGGSGRPGDRGMPEGGSGANYGGPPGGGDPGMTYTAPHVPHSPTDTKENIEALRS